LPGRGTPCGVAWSRGTPDGVAGAARWRITVGVAGVRGLACRHRWGKSWGRLRSRVVRMFEGVSSSGEAPMPQGVPSLRPVPPHSPLPSPCTPCWRSHPCWPQAIPPGAGPVLTALHYRSALPCTPYPLRLAEGVVPSTSTRGQLPRSGRRKEGGTNARKALEPSPVPFEFSRDDASGEALMPRGVWIPASPTRPRLSAIRQPAPRFPPSRPCPLGSGSELPLQWNSYEQPT
jgi:hypothetical protein